MIVFSTNFSFQNNLAIITQQNNSNQKQEILSTVRLLAQLMIASNISAIEKIGSGIVSTFLLTLFKNDTPLTMSSTIAIFATFAAIIMSP